LVYSDIREAFQSLTSNLRLTIGPYYYNDGISKELLCLHGTVAIRYRGDTYNIPVEIWLQEDHPIAAPLAYVKPTLDMYISQASKYVQPDGLIVLAYLKSWNHVR
jgi:ESCRT-I complex subunit TSG101